MQWQFCNYFKNHLHLTACRRRHAGGHRRSFFAAFPRAGTSPSPWRLRCALSQPGELIPAINSHRRRRRHRFPLCSAPPPYSSAARRRPRRAASAVPSYVNVIALVLRSSSTCSRRWCWPESPGATRLPRDRSELRRDCPHRGQAAPDHLRLHQAHHRDHGGFLSVLLTLPLTLLHRSPSYIDRRRVRAAMAGVEFHPVCPFLF